MMQSTTVSGAIALALAGLVAAPQALAASASFAYISEAGDMVGGGQRGSYTDANAQFQLQGSASAATFSVVAGAKKWLLRLAPPPGERLRPGRYYLAEHVGSRTGRSAGLDVASDLHSCTYVWGTVNVQQVAFDSNGMLTGLEAVAQQRCDHGDTPLLTVSMRYNLPPLSFKVKAISASPQWPGFDLGYAGDTTLFALSGTDTLLDYVASGRQNRWEMQLTPPTGKRLLKGTYAVAPQASAAAMGLRLTSRHYHACAGDPFSGSVQIKDVRYTNGVASRLSAEFELRCSDNDVLRGTIRHKL